MTARRRVDQIAEQWIEEGSITAITAAFETDKFEEVSSDECVGETWCGGGSN